MTRIVDTHRHAHLGGADHVDGSLPALEDLEDLAQETVREEHAGRLDADGGDVVLGRDGLDGAGLGDVVDQRARRVGVHGVQQEHRNARELGRLDAGRVQDLGAEIAQLGGLLEVEVPHGGGVVHDARIVVVHAVDVGPDLDLLRTHGRADQRRRVVGTAALQVVDLVVRVAADEALRQVERGLGVLGQQGVQLLADVVRVRLALDVDFHEIQRRQQLDRDPLLLQVEGHQVRGQELALADDDLGLHLREELLGEGLDIVEHAVGVLLRLVARLRCAIQLGDHAAVLGGEAVDGLAGALDVAVEQVVGNLHQGVGRAGHGRQDDEIAAAAGHQVRDMLDALCGPNGGAAEFHYFHKLTLNYLN